MNEPIQQAAIQTNLEKLKTGCFLRSIKKETSEPENIALGQVSKELRFIQRQSQYAGEITRVLKELHLTAQLIKDCRTGMVPAGVSRQELLSYYQGVFFTLVHQMKDKLAQLVYLMTETIIPEKPSKEDDVEIVKDLLKKKAEILEKIGITKEISEWDQASPDGGIAVVLRKRTTHHHRVTGLIYDNDFLNLGFTDIAQQESVQQTLSDYGKTQIEKIRTDSEERLFSGAETKSEITIRAIESNLEKISEALVRHFNLPTSQEEMREIFTAYTTMLGSFDVTNRCSIEKVIEPFKTMLNAFVEQIKTEYGENVIAIYLIGSLGRGEYEEGYSDFSLYFILNIEDPTGEGEANKRSDILRFNLKGFSEKKFASPENYRYRILAKIDGILLYGKDILKDEKIPKAGLLLGMALYDDILQILDKAAQWADTHPTASSLLISVKSKVLAKRLIDFMYAVVMSNKPQFTPSRKERAELISQMFQGGDKDIVETLMGVSRYGVGEMESFRNMFEGFRPQAEINLKKMLDVKTHIEKTGVK